MNYYFRENSLDLALVEAGQALLQHGEVRPTPGKQKDISSSHCVELPGVTTVELNHPMNNLVTLPSRKWNPALPYLESLWMVLGWNSLDDLPGRYVKSLYNFSDDGLTWRAGYGPRIRGFTPSVTQYKMGKHKAPDFIHTDQLDYVVKLLNKDPYTRQAVITIADPNKDLFDQDGNLLESKDFPCTRSIHFMTDVQGNLDCYVHMRSNDYLFGFSAVNVFNWTWLQMLVASMTELPLGKYYHMADNFHFYSDKWLMVRAMSNEPVKLEFSSIRFAEFSLEELDFFAKKLYQELDSGEDNKDEEYQRLYSRVPAFNEWRTVLLTLDRKDSSYFQELLSSSQLVSVERVTQLKQLLKLRIKGVT